MIYLDFKKLVKEVGSTKRALELVFFGDTDDENLKRKAKKIREKLKDLVEHEIRSIDLEINKNKKKSMSKLMK